MIKKLILMVAFVSSVFAVEPYLEIGYNNGDRSVSINYYPVFNQKDWVGIYKKGDSNSWDNVLKWSWMKDIAEGGEAAIVLPTTAGEYDVRYFLNNSFTTYKSLSVTIDEPLPLEAKVKFVRPSPIGENPVFRGNAIFIDSTSSGKVSNKDWIGIYKKGSDNSWNNVLGWTWVYWAEGEYNGHIPAIDIEHLPNGNYELRLFYHNSYKVEARAAFIRQGEIIDKIFPDNQVWDAQEGYYPIHAYNTQNKKYWIGVFRQGADRNINNLIAWTWTGKRIRPILKFWKKDLLQAPGTAYDIIMFKGEGYEQVGRTGTITINQ